ncbi:UNVERIFIED_CONTAM: hypothetical protein FKN15_044664 [Acipenser sinensis]
MLAGWLCLSGRVVPGVFGPGTSAVGTAVGTCHSGSCGRVGGTIPGSGANAHKTAWTECGYRITPSNGPREGEGTGGRGSQGTVIKRERIDAVSLPSDQKKDWVRALWQDGFVVTSPDQEVDTQIHVVRVDALLVGGVFCSSSSKLPGPLFSFFDARYP